jgi:hypothetical protein
MATEYAQMLCTNHRVVDGSLWYGRSTNGRKIARYFHPDPKLNIELYKACHMNHPSTIWSRASIDNYTYLHDLWVATCDEYTHRYGRVHESYRRLKDILHMPPLKIEMGDFTQPTPAMKAYPQCIVEGDSKASYRHFYWEDKREFATWTARPVPEWWKEYERQGRQTKTFVGA